MHEVRVHVHIEAPVERVFDAVSDHESFLRSEGGVRARVVRAGEPERNGLGCLREVRVGRRVRYVEEITAWQRPSAFEHMIRETSLPLRHAGSRLTLTPHGSGTNVEWTSRFEITVRILGRLLGVRARRIYAASFRGLLLMVARVAPTQPGPQPLDLAREFGDVVQRDLRGTRVVRRPTGALGPKRGGGGRVGSRSPLTPDPRQFKERQRPAESADRQPPVGAC